MGGSFWCLVVHFRNSCWSQDKCPFCSVFFGLFIGFVSVIFRGRIVRKSWKRVSARCIDKECKRVPGIPGLRGGARRTWTFLLICEFEMDGKRYTVTPGYWSTFISEARVEKFLDRVISSNGKCQLWVNPKNPLQTELISNDIKDLLLHN